MINQTRFLAGVPLFSHLKKRDLKMVAAITHQVDVDQGQTIFSKSSRGGTLYIVVKGIVKIFARSRLGKNKTFAFLEARDFFGEMALLEESRRSAAAVAMVPSILLTIQRNEFQQLLKKRPELSFSLLKTLCERLRQADEEIESLSFNSVLGQMAKILLDLSKSYGKKVGEGVQIGLSLSQRELAERAGTAREMVSRVLARFARSGCLSVEGKYLILTNIPKLRQWIG